MVRECHLIGEAPAATRQQEPPRFRAVAARLTEAQLRTFLTHPHGAMPDLCLTCAEIDDLVAYIDAPR